MAAANISDYSNEIESLAKKLDLIAKTVLPFYQQYLKPAYDIAYDVIRGRYHVQINIAIREIKRRDDSVVFSIMTYGPAFAINTKNTDDTSLHAELRSITSTIGHMAGAFLVAMNLHMAYLMDVKEILLTNFARDPVRAAQGIYRMFEPDLRHVEEEKVTTLANALQQSEGAMYRTVDGLQFKQDLDAYMQWISDRVATMKNNHPWRTSMMGGTKKRKEMNTPSKNNATQRLNNLTPLITPLPPNSENNNATQVRTPIVSRRSQRFRSAVPLSSQDAVPLSSQIATPLSSTAASSSSSFLSPLPWKLSPSPMPAQPNKVNNNNNNALAGKVVYYDSDSNEMELGQNAHYVAPTHVQTPTPPPRRTRISHSSSASASAFDTLHLTPVRPMYSLSSASPVPMDVRSRSSGLYQPADPRFMTSPSPKKGGNRARRHKKSDRKVETPSTMRHRARRRTYRARKNQSLHSLRNRRRALRTRRRGGACGSCMMGSQPSF